MHFELQERCFDGPSPWPMHCTAGRTTLEIDHNGRFRACELRGIVGDLRENNLDVSAVLASGAVQNEIGAIACDGCWCTHSCFIHESSKFSARAQLYEIPWAWWKQNFERDAPATLDEMERFRNLEVA